ncbi:hypothetical protein [Marinobacterium aestuariivivens]|uniref:Uncharacterized protein n=1 Tax=Marinobacterium aestuariivivens TaxID=1698799 RepID=A0ABW2A7D9_9GAMM
MLAFAGMTVHSCKTTCVKLALLPEKLTLDTARETVALFHHYWQSEKANLPLSSDVISTIESHLKKLPIA